MSRKTLMALVAARKRFDDFTSAAALLREQAKQADDLCWDALKDYREALIAHWRATHIPNQPQGRKSRKAASTQGGPTTPDTGAAT